MLTMMRLRLAFGADRTADPDSWVWTDVTEWLHMPAPIRYRWPTGSADGRSAAAAELTLSLRNTDGRFTWDNALSPYWPDVVAGVPIWFEISVDGGTTWITKFQGFVESGWPVQWPDNSGRWALAPVTAKGPLHRLVQGTRPVKSALTAAITSAEHDGLLACWPCEDGQDAGQAASAIPGQPPLLPDGTVKWAATNPEFLPGALPVPDLSEGGRLAGRVGRTGTVSPVEWTVQMFAQEASSGFSAAAYTLVEWTDTAGSTWSIVFTGSTTDPTFNTRLTYNGATVIEDNTTFADFFEWRIQAKQVGSNIQVQLIINGQSQGDLVPGGTGPWTATISSATLGWPDQIAVNPAGAVTEAVHGVGYIQVWEGTSTVPSFRPRELLDEWGVAYGNAAAGWVHEPAHYRIARTAAEAGLRMEPIPAVSPDMVTRMGHQQPGTDMEVIAVAERCDGGIVHEAGWGLAYVPREYRYNRATDLVINAGNRELVGDLVPIPADDRDLRNQWTARRPGGSSAVYTDWEHARRHDLLPGEADYPLYDDRPLEGIARWAVHLGIDERPRYDDIGINLHTAPHLVPGWLGCELGSWMEVINPPPQHPPYAARIVLLGAEEEWRGRRWWRARMWGTSPAPWTVAEVDGEQLVASDGSSLAADLAADGTTLLIESTGVPWVTDPAYFPLELRVGGERITVSAISGSSSPQTATVAPGGRTLARAWPAGTEVQVWAPAIVAL